MYARVAPALKLPRAMPDFFDYLVPVEWEKKILIGSIVRIVWRNRPIVGVVFALSDEAEFDPKKIRAISGLVANERYPEDVLSAMHTTAEECFIPLANVVESFLPVIPKRYKLTEATTPSSVNPARALESTKRLVASYTNAQEKYSRATDVAKDALCRHQSAIIIVPHADEVPDAAQACREAIGEEPIIIHGDLSAGAKWKAWLACASGEAVVVIGTRVASCAPVTSLGAVIVVESESIDHRQYDQNPRYDARNILRARAEMTGADLIFLSVAPRTEEYARTKESAWTFEVSAIPPTQTPIIATIGKAKTKEESVLSNVAIDAISNALQSGKKAILLLNRKGMASAVICNDCSRALRCARCKGVEAGYGSELRCGRCGTSRPVPTVCPACAGPTLKTLGFGTAALPKIIHTLFPQAKTVVVDADNPPVDATIVSADIIIGTQLLLHRLIEKPHALCIGTAITILADDLFISSGYRATENAWRLMRMLTSSITEPDGKAIVQTIEAPDSPNGQETGDRRLMALMQPPEVFYREELASRKAAAFPPCGEVVAVIVAEATSAKANERTREFIENIRRNAPGIRVTGPIAPRTPYRHGKWRSVAVIHGAESPAVRAILRSLPETFLIDVDPEYLG